MTIGLAGWLDMSFTVEWSFPYCMSQVDGPAYAVFGMPLPYAGFSGAASLLYDFMPHVYLLNLAVLCLLVFPALRPLFNRIDSRGLKRLPSILGGIGSLPVLSFYLGVTVVGRILPTGLIFGISLS